MQLRREQRSIPRWLRVKYEAKGGEKIDGGPLPTSLPSDDSLLKDDVRFQGECTHTGEEPPSKHARLG